MRLEVKNIYMRINCILESKKGSRTKRYARTHEQLYFVRDHETWIALEYVKKSNKQNKDKPEIWKSDNWQRRLDKEWSGLCWNYAEMSVILTNSDQKHFK